MKWLCLLVLFASFSLQNLICQNKISGIKVDASYSQATLKEIISDLGTRYSVKFSYSESLLPLNTKITCSVIDKSLNEVLEIIFSGTNIDYKIVKQQIVLFPIVALKECIVSGFVRDSDNGEGMIGVTVYTDDNTSATTTNEDGYYTLKLKEGKFNICFSFIGFALKLEQVQVTTNLNLNTELVESPTLLNEVLVTPDIKGEKILSALSGIEKVDIKTLIKLPNMLGEPDIIRGLSILPGVTSNELSIGEFNIRGGASNQTIFQMDEAPVSSVSHFGGIFSLFNSDIVKQVVVSKGNFTASEKGALSAVIDVKMKEGNKKEWEMRGGINTLFTRFTIEGPIIKDKTSIILGGRKSYIDQIIRLFPKVESPEIFQVNDVSLKIDHRFNWKNNLSLTAFYGNDFISQESIISTEKFYGILKWGHFFNQRFRMENKLIAGTYSLSIESDIKPELYNLEIKHRNYQFHSNYIYHVGDLFKIKAGYQAIWNENKPWNITSKSNESIIKDYSLFSIKTIEQSLFAETDIILFQRLAMNAGIRFTYFMHIGPYNLYNYSTDVSGKRLINDTAYYGQNKTVYTYLSPEPRISLRYLVDLKSSIKASYTRGTSFSHKLMLSTILIPIFRMVPGSKLFPPEKADNFSLGYYRGFLNNNLSTSVETYWRKMSNMTEFTQNDRLLYDDRVEILMHPSSGQSYGIEFSTTCNLNKFDIILNYAFANTRYKTGNINNNRPYPPPFDITHSLTTFASMKAGRRFEIGINWIFQSGLPYTEPSSMYYIDGRLMVQFDPEHVNTKRLPPYHRMDLSITLIPLKNMHRRWKSSWNMSICNLYMRKNPLGVIYYLEKNEDIPEMKTTDQWKPRYIYFYQFVPSISYNFKF